MFLKKAVIKNFQSYRDVTISFAKKITVFVGESQSGKTAIKRAVELAAFNKYGSGKNRGANYFSDFAGEEAQTKIVLDTTKGRVSLAKTIRNKDGEKKVKPKSTVYRAGSQSFRGVSKKVPDSVSDVLNLGEINFQGTLDSPFLVTSGAAEISRAINKILKIDIADEWRVEANRSVSEATAKVDSLKIEKQEAKELLNSLSLPTEIDEDKLELDRVCKALYGIESVLGIFSEIEQEEAEIEDVGISVEEFDSIQEKILEVEKLIEKITSAERTIGMVDQYNLLTKRIIIFKREQKRIRRESERFLKKEGICPFCEGELNQERIEAVLSQL